MSAKIIVRASLGTLASLGLYEVKMMEKPETAYLLQYSQSGCRACCAFCLQSRRLFNVKNGEFLGRISWPAVDLDTLASSWKKVFKRICLQTVVKPGFTSEVLEVLRKIRSFERDLPVSIAITPVSTYFLHELRKFGVDAIGVGLDACSPHVFEKWSKPYSWSTYWRFVEKAISVFGRGNVYVHLIIGLGETLVDVVNSIKKAYSMGARVSLFNYVDEQGRSRVDISYYRLIQVIRFLVENGFNPDEYVDYGKGVASRKIPIELTSAFYTSGCPSCNRPFYNEKPSGPIYNIPSENYLKLYMSRLEEELVKVGIKL
ncbi:MAG: radical SAM protein [Desulfurococcaceae archaeon]